MKRNFLSLIGCISLAGLLLGCIDAPVGDLRRDEPPAPLPTSEAGASNGPVSFRRDIRPLMDRLNGKPAGCKDCHYRGQATTQGIDLGGLDLTTLGSLRKGGISSGSRIVVPGAPDDSALLQKLEGRYPRGVRMPKDRSIWTDAEIALVRRWIAEGAQGADDE